MARLRKAQFPDVKTQTEKVNYLQILQTMAKLQSEDKAAPSMFSYDDILKKLPSGVKLSSRKRKEKPTSQKRGRGRPRDNTKNKVSKKETEDDLGEDEKEAKKIKKEKKGKKEDVDENDEKESDDVDDAEDDDEEGEDDSTDEDGSVSELLNSVATALGWQGATVAGSCPTLDVSLVKAHILYQQDDGLHTMEVNQFLGDRKKFNYEVIFSIGQDEGKKLDYKLTETMYEPDILKMIIGNWAKVIKTAN